MIGSEFSGSDRRGTLLRIKIATKQSAAASLLLIFFPRFFLDPDLPVKSDAARKRVEAAIGVTLSLVKPRPRTLGEARNVGAPLAKGLRHAA